MIRDSNFHQSGISVWPQGDTLKCLLVFALSSHFGVLLYSESKHWNSLQNIICVKVYTFAMDTRQQSSCLIDGDHFSYCIHIGSVSCQVLVAFEIAKPREDETFQRENLWIPGDVHILVQEDFFFKSILDTLTVAVSYWITLQPYSASLCLPGLQKGQIK